MAGHDESALRVFRFNSADNRFSEEIPVVSRDPNANTVTVALNRAGTYAIGATGPLDWDADGMGDAWETAHGLDPTEPGDAACDPDNDGLTNECEAGLGSDPHNPDTDADTCDDGFEYANSMDPTCPDSDHDSFAERTELELGTDPIDPASRPQLVIGTNQFDVSPVLTVAVGGTRFDRRTGRTSVAITVTNPTTCLLPIQTPVSAFVTNCSPAGTSLAVYNGTTLTGCRYVNVTGAALNDGAFAPGEAVTFELVFNNPGNKRLSFTVNIAGALARISL